MRATNLQQYTFQCLLRNPSFQEDLHNFLKKFPVYFRFEYELLAGYGRAEKFATKRWDRFLKKHSSELREIKRLDGSRILEYRLRKTKDSLDLEAFVEAIDLFESKLMEKVRQIGGKIPSGSLLTRLDNAPGGIPGLYRVSGE